MRDSIVYRCRKCGKLAYPFSVLPLDEQPPKVDCGCYTGPRWVRGIWMQAPDLNDGLGGRMKLQRRPLAESLRYLADMLVETASGLDDGPSARVGGVAVTLHMLADEEEGVGVFAPDHSDGPGPEESDTSGTYREGDVTVLGDLIGSEQIDGSPEAT